MFSDALWRHLLSDPFSTQVSLVDGLIVGVLLSLFTWRAVMHARSGAQTDAPGPDRVASSTLLVTLVIIVVARMAAIVT
jgi:hypothetical protein